MKVMILCGGMGTRLRDVSEVLPKPMVPVGGRPILWHVMKIFERFGHREFVLCLGYKGSIIKDYFLHYREHASDVVVNTRTGERTFPSPPPPEDWSVALVDTGLETQTAARVRRALRHVDGDEFLLTYADGLAPVDLDALLARHRASGALATVTAVRPSGRFGATELAGDRVVAFNEKPQAADGLVNGGFMVLTRAFVERYVPDDPAISLEREPLMQAARDGNLAAYVHDGWWQCMDTAREHDLLEELWRSGRAPWLG